MITFTVNNRANILVTCLIFAVLFAVMGDVIRDPDNVPGTDSYWHITLIDEAYDRFSAGQPIGPIAETINLGIPYLYGTGSTYPQFAYWVSVLVATVVGSAERAFTLLMFLSILSAQLTFFFGFRKRLGTVGAAFGALAFGYAPFLMTNVLPQGRFPAVLSIALLPLMFAAVLETLESPSKRWWIAGLLAVVLSTAFHAMVFYIAVIGVAVIAVAHVLSIRTSIKRIALTGAMIVLGVFLAWLFLPTALSSLSPNSATASTLTSPGDAGVRASTGADSEIVPFSIRWNSFDADLRNFNENYAGLGLAIAALFTMVVTWRRRIVLYGGATVFVYVLATGSLTPFWEMIPLASQLEPRRFLFPAYLGAGLVIGSGVAIFVSEIRYPRNLLLALRGVVALIVIAGLVVYDAVPMTDRINPERREQERVWTRVANDHSNGGRALWMFAKDFAPYFYIGRKANVETVGRNADLEEAILQGYPETSLNKIALMDIRMVLTEATGVVRFVDLLNEHGFVERNRFVTQALLTSDRPASRVQEASRSVGLIGAAATKYWSRIIPSSINISSVSRNNASLVESLDAIVLSPYSISDDSDAESILMEYVETGGKVIIGEPNQLGEDIFETQAVQRVVPRVLSIDTDEGKIETRPFEIGGGAFVGNFYDDAGEAVIVGTGPDGEEIALVQKRVVGDGAIYWVCCNVGNHIIVNPGDDLELAHLLRDYFETEIGGYRDVWPAPFGSNVMSSSPSDFEFEYESESPIIVVISDSKVPQRVIEIDDEIVVEPFNYGKAYAVPLPAGSHRVHIFAETTALTPTVIMVWLIALAATAVLLISLWDRFSLLGPAGGGILGFVRRWFTEPPFVVEIQVSNGTVQVCEPRIGRRIDLKYSSGNNDYVRIETAGEDRSLAVVLIEVNASDTKNLTFDTAQLNLISQLGTSYLPIPATDITPVGLLVPNLFYMFDTKSQLLERVIELDPSESKRGLLVYEFSTTEEYPFVHDEFMKLKNLTNG